MAQQFNVPLSERYAVTLRALALRDETSVPDTLRPVVERHLDEALRLDPDLNAAVEALLRARTKKRPAKVSRLPAGRRRAAPADPADGPTA